MAIARCAVALKTSNSRAHRPFFCCERADNVGPDGEKGLFVQIARRSVSFSAGLATIFGVLFALLAAVGNGYWVSQTQSLAIQAATQRFELVSMAVVDKIERAIEPTELLLGLLARDARSIPSLQCDWCEPMAWAMVNQAQVSSVYVGYPNDDFVRVTRFAEPRMRDRARAPITADWGMQIIKTVNGKRVSRWAYFLDSGQPVGDPWVVVNPDFKPTTRPWFIDANMQPGKGVFTAPYLFAATELAGITMARTLADTATGTLGKFGAAVAGVDMGLNNWSDFLSQAAAQSGIHGARLAIVNDDRRVLAYSQPQALSKLIATDLAGGAAASLDIPRIDLLDRAADVALSNVLPSSAGRYQASLTEPMFGGLFPLKREFGGPSYALIVAKEADLNREINALRNRSIFVAFGAAGLVIPFVALLGWLLARPMKALARQAAGIAQLQEPTTAPRRSLVREVRDLSKAIHSAQSTVAHFGRYVPIGLVRDIVRQGVAPQLGGKRQMASLLFTDIEGFSLLSEQLSPEELTERMTQYFSVVAGVLIAHGATIDKYIGDSVMAFWNAPHEQANHSTLAAQGALAALAAIDELNAKWQAQGLAAMPTRFGLHRAEVVIGNVGSADRMNYTALGAAVNMASRLEGANKAFGSHVLMSEAFSSALDGQFLQANLGLIVPSGTSQPISVSVLVAAKASASAAQAASVKSWQPVIGAWAKATSAADFGLVAAMVSDHLTHHPGDKVAQRMLSLAQAFASGQRAIASDGAIWLGQK